MAVRIEHMKDMGKWSSFPVSSAVSVMALQIPDSFHSEDSVYKTVT